MLLERQFKGFGIGFGLQERVRKKSCMFQEGDKFPKLSSRLMLCIIEGVCDCLIKKMVLFLQKHQTFDFVFTLGPLFLRT